MKNEGRTVLLLRAPRGDRCLHLAYLSSILEKACKAQPTKFARQPGLALPLNLYY
jgi:hypothetical protein